jgi:polycystin 1L2
MRIWHDNSGSGDDASWFLKYIIVHDLQTRQKFYFICYDWLAVEKSDGKIERELFVTCEPQKTELKYLLKKNAQHNIKDSHVWLSIFNRPMQSSFTRLDRVTCCFVLLYLTMLLNIIYYTSSDDVESNSRFIYITLEQVN